MARRVAIPLLLALSLLVLPGSRAQSSNLPQETNPLYTKGWPLRLHILAIDDTHRTVRLQPQWSSGSLPDLSTGDIPAPSSDQGATTLGGGPDDFSGAGRADLVTPPGGATTGLNFTYEGCSRIRVPPGFQGLEARWLKPGSRLEVMIPTDALNDGPAPVKRCTIKLTTQPFVYLRLRNGSILRVTPDAYNKKPALRAFLSGPTETLRRRTAALPRTTPQPE